MSRIIVLEVPDKYEVSSRTITKLLQEKYPDVELRISAGFNWWKDICSKKTDIELLPMFPSKRLIDNIEIYIENMRNPKSIEERNITGGVIEG